MEESTKLVDESTEALWYVVHTYSGYENKVANDLQTMVENRHLQELICDIKVPVEMVPEIDKNGKQKMVEHKLFPGYVLVKMVMNDDTWYVVRNTRGCTGFVGPASKPVPLTAEEVEKMGVEKAAPLSVDFAVGDTVQITAGPLEGFMGLVEAIDTENFKVNVKDHQVCLAHLLRNAEYLNELDSNQDWSRRFIQLIEHSINLRREGNITSRKIKVLKTKMKNLLGESLTHLDNEFEKFKRGILKVKDYLFTFLSNPSVPYDNNASERGVRKIKIKQKVSGCFRTDGGADDFAKLHSIAETAMKNGNSKFNAILAVVQQ